MEVLYHRGIHLPGLSLWLDPHLVQPAAVVTHAHSDHSRPHRRVISTVATAALMRARGLVRPEFQTVAYREPVPWEGGTITLYPAGHILGSAQALVECDGRRLLYSGDFKLAPGAAAEPAEVPQADIVIMETTFGRPRYRFPRCDQVAGEIEQFCRGALADGAVPALFCYSLGKCQELVARLAACGLPLFLEDAHFAMTCCYRELGAALPEVQRIPAEGRPEGVVLCSSSARREPWWPRLGRVRTAYVSGWAAEPGARWRFRTDAAFPLSDHADHPALLEYVERTGAGRVYTVHGFAEEFSGELRRRGYWSEPLREPGPQLAFGY